VVVKEELGLAMSAMSAMSRPPPRKSYKMLYTHGIGFQAILVISLANYRC
jgi:hypothetical protein